jgi:hypothetical protein
MAVEKDHNGMRKQRNNSFGCEYRNIQAMGNPEPSSYRFYKEINGEGATT